MLKLSDIIKAAKLTKEEFYEAVNYLKKFKKAV